MGAADELEALFDRRLELEAEKLRLAMVGAGLHPESLTVCFNCLTGGWSWRRRSCGWPWCADHDVLTRFAAANSCNALTTW